MKFLLGRLKPIRKLNPFIIFFFCIVALVIFVGLFSYSESKKIIEAKVAASTEQTIAQAADKIELILLNFEDMTTQLQQDGDLSIKLQDYNDSKNGGNDKLLAASSINNKLFMLANGKSGIANIKTSKGWLTTFHAVDIDASRGKNGWEPYWKKRYSAGIMQPTISPLRSSLLVMNLRV